MARSHAADPAADHAAAARAVLTAHEHLAYPGMTQDVVAQQQIARAQVDATLAVAEELRTANLIALGALEGRVLAVDPNSSYAAACTRLSL